MSDENTISFVWDCLLTILIYSNHGWHVGMYRRDDERMTVSCAISTPPADA